MLRQLHLPESKLCEVRVLSSKTSSRHSITKHDFQSLVRKLNFAACVVCGGRTFLQQIIDIMNNLSRPHQHTRVNSQLRTKFLASFNGVTFFVDSELIHSEEFSTDACPVGGDSSFQGDWFYTDWAVDHPQLTTAHINQKETFTVLVALKRWKHQLHDKWVVARSDNYTTISALKKGSCRNQRVMQWLHQIFWFSATYNY